MRICKIYLITT